MNYRCLKGLVYPQVSEVENWPIEDGVTGDGDTIKNIATFSPLLDVLYRRIFQLKQRNKP